MPPKLRGSSNGQLPLRFPKVTRASLIFVADAYTSACRNRHPPESHHSSTRNVDQTTRSRRPDLRYWANLSERADQERHHPLAALRLAEPLEAQASWWYEPLRPWECLGQHGLSRRNLVASLAAARWLCAPAAAWRSGTLSASRVSLLCFQRRVPACSRHLVSRHVSASAWPPRCTLGGDSLVFIPVHTSCGIPHSPLVIFSLSLSFIYATTPTLSLPPHPTLINNAFLRSFCPRHLGLRHLLLCGPHSRWCARQCDRRSSRRWTHQGKLP